MQTRLTPQLLASPDGKRADNILRKCVHCGFCNATCPTYQLLGDELDGPRGRIYQIKQFLEGNAAGNTTQAHLDRCLTCRNCETTCPSGVEYHELLDIGRKLIDERVKRTPWDRFRRWSIRQTLAYPARFKPLLRTGQWLRPLMPAAIKQTIPPYQRQHQWPGVDSKRQVLVLQGCVQPLMSPSINHATADVLTKLGIRAIPESPAGCCGALHHHTSAPGQAREFMRRRIDCWWSHVEDGVEAIVSTASGCGVHVKEYGHLLADDPDYADKARRISALTVDIAELIHGEDLNRLDVKPLHQIAFHPPCTLQHGQRLTGLVENILQRVGMNLVPVADSHLCCGSAGSYSLLNPSISEKLGQQKIRHLTKNNPALVVTANIGCLHHLAGKTALPVKHWIELLAKA